VAANPTTGGNPKKENDADEDVENRIEDFFVSDPVSGTLR
jgi:hypothetical protein